MKVFINRGYYEVVSCDMLTSSLNFLTDVTTDMVWETIADPKNKDAAVQKYENRIRELVSPEKIEIETLSLDVEAPGTATFGGIYLYGSVREFRKTSNDQIILLRLLTPVKHNLDIIISPRQFGYGEDFTELDAEIAYLICEPSPVNPDEIIETDYVRNHSLRSLSYNLTGV